MAPAPTHGEHQPMRLHAPLALTLLLAACGTDPDPKPAGPDPAESAAAEAARASASARQHPSYDPALKTGFMTERDPDPTKNRTYTYPVGGQGAGERLRPGWWRSEGGPCDWSTGTERGDTYTIGNGGWAPEPAYTELRDGATFVVTHLSLMQGIGCIWRWEGAVS